MRLNKYISESGLCSRRQADRFIEQGVVTINGHRAGVGAQVRVGDFVSVQGRAIEPREKSRTVLIALNKPVGIVSTTEQSERANIVKFVSHPERIFPIGRLDKDSQGLIFLTSDGDLVNKILRAGNEHEKEYLVTVNKPVTDAFVDGMAGGVPMLGQMTKRCTVERVADRVFRIVLVQGLNRQIRRMCEHFGYGVEKLERTRIMHVSLAGIASGDWRDLTDEELAELDRLLEGSTGEATAKKSSRKAPKGASASGSGKAAVTTGGPTKAARAAAKKRANQRKAKPKKRNTRKPGARVGKQAGPNKGRRRR